MADLIAPDYLLGYSPVVLDTHPLPAPVGAVTRWNATRARRRLMEGVWHWDLFLWAQAERDPALLAAMGNLDLSECLYRSVVEQLAVLYEEEPKITPPAEASPALVASMPALFSLHQQLDEAVRAYSEAAIVLDLQPRLGRPDEYDVAPCLLLPDEFDAEAMAPGSRQVCYFTRAVRRHVPCEGGPLTWGWDVWDLRGAEPEYHFKLHGGSCVPGYSRVGNVTLAVEGEEHEGDATPAPVGDGWSTAPTHPPSPGQGYYWRYEDGTPFIPAVLYHAEPGNKLFKPYRWPELARATLENAMMWTDWRESFRNASWVGRVIWDGEIEGAKPSGDGETATIHVAATPAGAIRMRSLDANHPGRTEMMEAPVDVHEQALAIGVRHRIRATSIGLHPTEIEQTSAESGVALTIRREGQRRAQRKVAPQMRLGDVELIQKWVATRKTAGLPAGPERGWSIDYPAWPETREEAELRRADEKHDLDLELADRADVLMRRHDLTRPEAELLAARIAAPDKTLDELARTDPRPPLPLEPPPPRPDEPEHPYAGRLDFQGLPVLVETAAGQVRSGVDPDGNPWSVTMPWHYGEIEGTLGLDGEPIDVMVGPNPESQLVYVFHLRVPGQEEAEEDKGYLGYDSEEQALAAFRAAYTRHDILSGFTRWTLDRFRAFVMSSASDSVRLDAPPGSGLPVRSVEVELVEDAPADLGGASQVEQGPDESGGAPVLEEETSAPDEEPSEELPLVVDEEEDAAPPAPA